MGLNYQQPCLPNSLSLRQVSVSARLKSVSVIRSAVQVLLLFLLLQQHQYAQLTEEKDPHEEILQAPPARFFSGEGAKLSILPQLGDYLTLGRQVDFATPTPIGKLFQKSLLVSLQQQIVFEDVFTLRKLRGPQYNVHSQPPAEIIQEYWDLGNLEQMERAVFAGTEVRLFVPNELSLAALVFQFGQLTAC